MSTATGQPAAEAGDERRSRRSLAADLLERYALLIVWLGVIVVFGILRPDTFLTTANFSTIFGSQAILVVLTLALIVPLTAGDYDLSVAATMGISAMTLAILNVNHGWSIGLSIAAALGVGLLIGLVNGAVSLYYYAKPLKEMFLTRPGEGETSALAPSRADLWLVGLLSAPLVVFGLVGWGALTEFAQAAAVVR